MPTSSCCPGSKSTVDDLAWLRATGLAAAIVDHARAGRPVLGICGGFQMLGRVDPRRRSRAAVVGSTGSGCCRSRSRSRRRRRCGTPPASAFGVEVSGYEIHHGYVSAADRRAGAADHARRTAPARAPRPRRHLRHALARRVRVGRVPARVPRRGRPGRPAGPASSLAPRHGLRRSRRERTLDAARRPRRGTPRHGRAVAADRGRSAARAAVPATGRTMSTG